MDLSKIKTLIDFVGRSNITELTVTEKDETVRIFRMSGQEASAGFSREAQTETGAAIGSSVETSSTTAQVSAFPVKAPVFGVLHRSPAPGQEPFVKIGDTVEEGQTLLVIEAMKVFNKITAPRAGRITRLTDIDGGEVETGDVLAEIA